jgi:hypothetical protein
MRVMPSDETSPLALTKPENIVSYKKGTAYVVFLPHAPELTEPEKKRIDTAPRARFFVYGCPDAPVPQGVSGLGTLEDYPVESLQWAISRPATTYITPEILDSQRPRDTPQALLSALMDLAADTCSNEHRSAVIFVTDRSFAGDDRALYRPSAPLPGDRAAGRRSRRPQA